MADRENTVVAARLAAKEVLLNHGYTRDDIPELVQSEHWSQACFAVYQSAITSGDFAWAREAFDVADSWMVSLAMHQLLHAKTGEAFHAENLASTLEDWICEWAAPTVTEALESLQSRAEIAADQHAEQQFNDMRDEAA